MNIPLIATAPKSLLTLALLLNVGRNHTSAPKGIFGALHSCPNLSRYGHSLLWCIASHANEKCLPASGHHFGSNPLARKLVRIPSFTLPTILSMTPLLFGSPGVLVSTPHSISMADSTSLWINSNNRRTPYRWRRHNRAIGSHCRLDSAGKIWESPP